MKNCVLVALLLFCVSEFSAQSSSPRSIATMKPWKTTYFTLGLAIDNDRFSKMSLDNMMAFSKNPEEIQRDLSNMTSDVTPTTAGIALYTSIGLAPINRNTGNYRTDRELRIGAGLHGPKEAMVTYKNADLDTSIVYCNLHSELTLEGAYILKSTFGKHGRCYAGVGINGGMSFGNQMVLITGQYFDPGAHPTEQLDKNPVMEMYAAKSVYYTRLYIPYGVHYGVDDKWSIGIDFRIGIGAQFIAGEPGNFIQKTGMFSLGMMKRI